MSESYDFGINSATKEALDNYLALKKPEFAVLINGKWGCGKTWFIRKYFAERESEKQTSVQKEINSEKAAVYCYVSLFEVENTAEIDKAILACVNPLLKAKDSSLGRLGRAIVDYAVEAKVPYASTAKKGMKFVTSIVEGFLSRLPNPLILVFDDIERTRIPMELVLGYISNMLDVSGASVIVLCNDEQMSEKQSDIFYKFKEKVIGITLTVKSNFDEVFEDAIGVISDEYVRNVILKNKDIIDKVFYLSEADNLRNLKRILYNFNIFYKIFNHEMQNNGSYIADVLVAISAYTIESSRAKDEKSFSENIDEFYIKYKNPNIELSKESVRGFHFYDVLPLDKKSITDFFYRGSIDKEKIEMHYLNSKYNPERYKQSVPLQLTHFWVMKKEEFDKLLKTMRNDLTKGVYTDASDIINAFDTLIELSKSKITQDTLEEILQMSENYLNKVTINPDSYLFFDNFNEIEFKSKGDVVFRKIIENVKKKTFESLDKEKSQILKKVCGYLPGNVKKFTEEFPYKKTKFEGQKFYPVGLDTSSLATSICLLDTPDLREVLLAFLEVVQPYSSHINFSTEVKHWVNNFCADLEKHSETIHPLCKVYISHYVARMRSVSSTEESFPTDEE